MRVIQGDFNDPRVVDLFQEGQVIELPPQVRRFGAGFVASAELVGAAVFLDFFFFFDLGAAGAASVVAAAASVAARAGVAKRNTHGKPRTIAHASLAPVIPAPFVPPRARIRLSGT